MNNSIIIAAAAITFLFSACNNSSTKSDSVKSDETIQTFNLDTTKLKGGETFYQCEMHPEVISDIAGQCPKCGMDLVEMKKH